MAEFVALGGTVDPAGKKPPIGGSAYALISGDSALLVDFGVYSYLVEKENKEAEISLEYMEIGNIRLPVLPMNLELLKDEETLLAELKAKFLPPDEILSRIPNLFVVGSHAHIDHVGALPYLKRQFPHAHIMMTKPTLDISYWNWHHNLRLAKEQGRRPLFTELDVERLHRSVELVGVGDSLSFDRFEVVFLPAGHILGAVSVLVTVKEMPHFRVFFTGDISFGDQHTVGGAPLLKTDVLGRVDYLVTEATNAGKESPPLRSLIESRLIADVTVVLERGGRVFFPAPSIGRSQEIFAVLAHHGIADRWPVSLDGSTRDIARIYAEHSSLPRSIEVHFVQDYEERLRIADDEKPRIVISSSGTVSGGPSVTYAKAFLENERNLVAFTSYQHPSSTGSRILAAKEGDVVALSKNDAVRVAAKRKRYTLSAHMSGDELLELIDRLHPEKTFLTHGEEAGMEKVRREATAETIKATISTRYQL